MGRTEGALSKMLERSMNNQCRFMTLEECLRNEVVIDKLDDERREKSFKNTKWHKDMRRSYQKRLDAFLEELLKNGVPMELLSVGTQISKDSKEHDEKFFSNVAELEEKEVFFEDQSDSTRDYMVKFTSKALELSRMESSEVEKKMMEENLMKRLEGK
ncbi:hypothetical protein PM10SUCC1_38230 [Propionigenium maris DSM 9537]|uniref:Uncharacterized protein n=1 Tax=Propionigenium maris DSM 9537 TaxID=1123000 RepID=A0A9W6LPR0_9FUSO|nr:hypothetical protein [Propionigenium maris]GLI58309.1 hypothetical protein PM10SUCC1_38230 [Propionigenium maris DSM 9537]